MSIMEVVRMEELIHKIVKIVFNPATGTNSGIIGTTCCIKGFEQGFMIVTDYDNRISYYALNCIKSITLLEKESEQKEQLCL